MNAVHRLSAAVALVLVAGLAASCASEDQPAEGGIPVAASPIGDSPSGGAWADGEPVRGNASISWKNLNPENPPAFLALVNESSEIGQKLKSGRATSSEIRVVSDAQFGGLLSQMRALGFFDRATDGLGLDSIPEVSDKRGILVLNQDGHSKGILLTLNLGPGPVTKTYDVCKKTLITAHARVPGLDVQSSIGAPDERVFSVPKPTLRRP